MTLGPLTFWPAAFWLIPPILAVLIWLRYFRTRRQELLAGSLLLWRRLAAQTPKTPPKRFIIDRTLILQVLALLALIAALSAPQWSLNQNRGRALLLVIDNGPLSRARTQDAKPLWSEVLEKSRAILSQLHTDDIVYLARSSPLPRLLSAQGVTPAAARELLNSQSPALSGPSPDALWLFASDTTRSLGKDTPLALAVVSLQDRPSSDSAGRQWLCAAPQGVALKNVGIIDFGATPVTLDGKPATQLLARVKNYSAQPLEGILSADAGGAAPIPDQHISLPAQSEQAVVFSLSNAERPVRIAWHSSDGKADSFPDDDSIIATPRPIKIPRVRFHAPVPALEKLYRSALNAVIVDANDSGEVDLEIYAGSVPEKVPSASHGFLLLAPEAGYHSFFDVSEKTLVRPKAQLDKTHALTRGIGDKPEGLFPIPKACEILSTGDFQTLVKDAQSERALVMTFPDEQRRPAFVLAFVPGSGFPPDRLLDPELAAILVRMALQAGGSGDPFEITQAAKLELASGEPLPADWKPEISAPHGAGVLNESVSALSLGDANGEQFDAAALQPLDRGSEVDLRPWLILIALALLAWESFGTLISESRTAKIEAQLGEGK